ncbi:glycoside hydrolase family 88 protein [Pedobacter immunditicola]|uniref:glycoside hydrolase family 88 protein n=1 Tax=Pedobacter immunditicola TaxID=3133440 RepID=UPI00309DE6C2
MKYQLTVLLLLVFVSLTNAQKVNTKKAFKHASTQTQLLLLETGKTDKGVKNDLVSPRTIEKEKLKLVRSRDWTSGFFPGVLWLMYEQTKDPKFKEEAQKYTANLEKEQFNTGTHDLGFIINCSFGNGYRLGENEAYRKVIIEAAKSLSTRFNPTAGVIRSWDHNRNKWQYPVIIDNMMNLELLFEATKLTGDSSFYKIAVTHANTTLKNHFRPDYSSFHVVDYDTENGAVRGQATHQGYSDGSAWARGQAWALYGYTLCYRETKDEAYLKQAEGIADFILSHKNLPADLVPYWDFNDPAIPGVPRDASAAAITASALYELRSYSKNQQTYTAAANKMLKSLTKNYTSNAGDNYGFILEHSTGHKPVNSEVDVPLNYADYYYLEALLRYEALKKL